ncbi:MAG: hypothetical protein ACT4PP_04180 [Sporichthyaceae bacterium]
MRAYMADGGGPFTVQQAIESGLTADDIRAGVRRRELVRLRRAVLVTAGDRAVAARSAATLHAQDVAAVMLALRRSRVVAAGASAARIYDLEFMPPAPPDDIVLLSDDATVSGTHRDGYYLRRAPLPAEHLAHRHGVPITTAARTLLDLTSTMDLAAGVALVESAYHLKCVGRPELLAMLEQADGRPGVTRARASFYFAAPGAESVLESVSRVTMHQIGVPAPLTQVTLIEERPQIRADFYWPQYRLVGEADGMTKYLGGAGGARTLDVVRAERQREQRLRDAGYDIVRWDWSTAQSPSLLAARLNAAFDRATQRLAGQSS